MQNYLSVLGVGYRFMPTDHELIYYLREKVKGQLLPIREIITMDVYKGEPWILRHQLERAQMTVDDVYMYFFVKATPRERRAGKGYWHASSGVHDIFDPQSRKLMGEMRNLVYYSTPSKDTRLKTNWIMHEYRLVKPRSGTNKDLYWTICKIGKTGKSKLTAPEVIVGDQNAYHAHVAAPEVIVGDQSACHTCSCYV